MLVKIILSFTFCANLFAATMSDYKVVQAPAGNELQRIEVVWDYSLDGGATSTDLDIIKFDSNVIVHSVVGVVTSNLTSSTTSATVEMKVQGNTYIAATALTSFATAYQHWIGPILSGSAETLPNPRPVESGFVFSQSIGVAALTGGKIKYVFVVGKL